MDNLKKERSPILIWLTMILFFIYQYVARSSFPSVLTTQYMDYFSLDASGVAIFVSSYYLLYTLAQIPVGNIIDRVSLRLIACIAILICASGELLFVVTRNPIIGSIGQMMVGFGSATAILLVFKIIADWFPPRKRPMMIAYSVSVGALSPVIFGPLVATLVKIFDWKIVIVFYSIIGYLLCVLVWFVVVDKKHPVEETQEVEGKVIASLMRSLKSFCQSPQAWLLLSMSFLQYVPLSSLADLWGTSYIKSVYNTTPAVSSFANNMMYLGVVCGGPILSYLANFFGSYKKSIAISAFGALLGFLMICMGDKLSLNMMFFAFFLVGSCSGGVLLFPILIAMFPKTMSATVSAIVNMGSMLSGIIISPAIGYFMDQSWAGALDCDGGKAYSIVDYQYGFRPVICCLVLAVILSFFIKDKSPHD